MGISFNLNRIEAVLEISKTLFLWYDISFGVLDQSRRLLHARPASSSDARIGIMIYKNNFL